MQNNKMFQEMVVWAKKNGIQITNNNLQEVLIKYVRTLPLEKQLEYQK